MFPIVKTTIIKRPARWVKSHCDSMEWIGNVCLDKKGRECTQTILGYYLLAKDGQTLTNRKVTENV